MLTPPLGPYLASPLDLIESFRGGGGRVKGSGPQVWSIGVAKRIDPVSCIIFRWAGVKSHELLVNHMWAALSYIMCCPCLRQRSGSNLHLIEPRWAQHKLHLTLCKRAANMWLTSHLLGLFDLYYDPMIYLLRATGYFLVQ